MMMASEMLDLDRAMSPADQWLAEDSGNPVTNFKIPDTVGIFVEMLAVDAHGTVTMRRLWPHLAKLLAACERRSTATCVPDRVMGMYHFTGCCNDRHVWGCALSEADTALATALAAVHATGGLMERADARSLVGTEQEG